MDETSGVSRLDCGHRFHGTCLVPHLQKDPRCPCCRTLPRDYIYPEHLYDDETAWRGDSDIDDDEPGPTISEAIKNARQIAKTDKRLARQLDTMRKWRTA